MSPYKPFIETGRAKNEASGSAAGTEKSPVIASQDQIYKPGSTPYTLEAEAISVGYPGLAPVISDLSFGLERGKVLAVIGPNGSGKTTLFRALAGELTLAAGRVLARTRRDCLDIHKLPARTKARLVTRVLQNEQSAWAVPVADYVQAGLFAAEGWFSHNPARAAKKNAWALDAMGISFLAERPVTELSGGEFRRVVIARALIQDTDILLLDEPTADLDLEHQMETLKLLLDLAKAGKAVAFSVHDLNLASMAADEVLLLKKGRMAAKGSPKTVLTPDIIKNVYGARVIVGSHPTGAAPHVILDPEWLHTQGEGT
ncbi:MAG: ABC transporter ATP-binding protein [Spirochaetia bacterium]|jgi:iron complex transport system ATP-binding protein|nr:ABC transporter ATP-binding protein [Spirochaetia bacterium]